MMGIDEERDQLISEAVAVVLAEPPDPSVVGPGRLAFAVVAVLAVVTAALVVSMLRHLRKVPPTFDPPSGSVKDDGEPNQG